MALEEDPESLGLSIPVMHGTIYLDMGSGSCALELRTQTLKQILQDWINVIGASKIRDNVAHDFLKEVDLTEEAVAEAYTPLADILAFYNLRLPPINKWRVS